MVRLCEIPFRHKPRTARRCFAALSAGVWPISKPTLRMAGNGQHNKIEVVDVLWAAPPARRHTAFPRTCRSHPRTPPSVRNRSSAPWSARSWSFARARPAVAGCARVQRSFASHAKQSFAPQCVTKVDFRTSASRSRGTRNALVDVARRSHSSHISYSSYSSHSQTRPTSSALRLD